jgi:hypothetical protein
MMPGAAEVAVAEPIDVSIALDLADELAAACAQARDDGIDVRDAECA